MVLLSPALPAAENEALPPAPPRKKLSAISLLPDGSELKGVMLPRYDERHRLTGVLKSKTMTLVNSEVIAGETVSIEFFNPDLSPRGRVDLKKALFYQTLGILNAMEAVTISSDRLIAKGTGLIYAFEKGEGFLTGPSSTRVQAPIETTMNPTSSPIKAAGIVGASMLATSLAAAPPQAVTPTEAAAIQADAASKATEHAAAAAITRTNLRADLETSSAATATAQSFLENSEIISKTPSAEPPPTPDHKPLDVTPSPADTLIQCDGGMYFDADGGLFVYLKNVRVQDPRFHLSGANELKVILGKKPEPAAETSDKPTAEKPRTGTGLGAKFGDVERIIATGAVRVLQKQPEAGKEPVEASGAIFTYHTKSGEIILSGGFPWVKQGATFMRAKEPNLILRIQKNGSFVTEGNWEMGGKIDQKP